MTKDLDDNLEHSLASSQMARESVWVKESGLKKKIQPGNKDRLKPSEWTHLVKL